MASEHVLLSSPHSPIYNGCNENLDNGIHGAGWNRQKARGYFHDHKERPYLNGGKTGAVAK